MIENDRCIKYHQLSKDKKIKEVKMCPLVILFISLSLILCLLNLTRNNWYENIQIEYNSGLFIKCSELF